MVLNYLSVFLLNAALFDIFLYWKIVGFFVQVWKMFSVTLFHFLGTLSWKKYLGYFLS